MEKYERIIVLVLIVIMAISIFTILQTEKYQLAILIIRQGGTIVELNNDAITFVTDTKYVTYYDFGYGLYEMKNE